MFCKKLLHLPSFNCIVPSQVTSMAVFKAVPLGKPGLKVTWIPPQSDVAITQYHVQYKRKDTTSWRTTVSPASSGSATSTYLKALNAGTTYQVRVRGASAIGNGTWSSVKSKTTYMRELFGELC